MLTGDTTQDIRDLHRRCDELQATVTALEETVNRLRSEVKSMRLVSSQPVDRPTTDASPWAQPTENNTESPAAFVPNPNKAYTVSVVGKILGVSNRTITKWVDNGSMEGFRIPQSRHRRVTYSAIETFAKKHKLHINTDHV